MAEGLTKTNVAKVVKRVSKEGFTVKFWREYRSRVCSGKGVAKAMEGLKRLGIGPDGSPKGVKPHDINAVIGYLEELEKSMRKAHDKCGKLQEESKLMCKEYLKQIRLRLNMADSMKERFTAATQPGAGTDPKKLKELQKLYKAVRSDLDDAGSEIGEMKKDILTGKKMMQKAMDIWKKEIGKEGPRAQHHQAAKGNLARGLATADLKDNSSALKAWDKDLKKNAGKLPKSAPSELAHEHTAILQDTKDGIKVISLLIKDIGQMSTYYKKAMDMVDKEAKKDGAVTPG